MLFTMRVIDKFLNEVLGSLKAQEKSMLIKQMILNAQPQETQTRWLSPGSRLSAERSAKKRLTLLQSRTASRKEVLWPQWISRKIKRL